MLLSARLAGRQAVSKLIMYDDGNKTKVSRKYSRHNLCGIWYVRSAPGTAHDISGGEAFFGDNIYSEWVTADYT